MLPIHANGIVITLHIQSINQSIIRLTHLFWTSAAKECAANKQQIELIELELSDSIIGVY